jgi:hypothetical protein
VLRVTNGRDRGAVTSPLVIVLLKALAQCGGPVPRPAQRTIQHQDAGRLEFKSTVWTQVVEEMEWLNGAQMARPTWGGRPRQPQWREAGALQRARCVREWSPESIEYDPSVMWVASPKSVTAVKKAARRELNVQFALPFKPQRCYGEKYI